MSLDPLLQAPLVIQVHAFGAIVALVIGLIQLFGPKGTAIHITLGVVWVVLMAVIAASSAFILHPAPAGAPYWERLTPIHLFIPVTAFGLVGGVRLLMRGGPTLKFHSRPFIGVFVGGLIVAGVLAFLPGRIMHAVAFGG